MIEYLMRGKDPKLFGGTMSMEAQLDAKVVDDLKMRAALLRFAAQLAKQYKSHGRKPTIYQVGTRVIGVQLHSITFSLVTEPIPKER